MRRLLFGIVWFLAAFMPEGVSVASTENKSTGSELKLHIELASPGRAAGKVVFVDHGTDAITIWRAGNSWADEALSFEILVDGVAHRVVRKPQVYTRNVAATVVLASGDRYEVPFDLGDGGWDVAPAAAAAAQLVAVYRPTASTEAAAQRVWTGERRSAPTALR